MGEIPLILRHAQDRLSILSRKGRGGHFDAAREAVTRRAPHLWSWQTAIRGRLRVNLLVMLSFVGLAALACGQGTYPLDIFYEMHYQQSYKSHEPPRLAGVENAVPVGWVPAPKSTSFNTGSHLFNVNCSMCHGLEGKGNGPVLETMKNIYGYEPAITPDLTSDQVRVIGEPGIQAFMLSGVVVMPSFKKLLTVEEMRMIAQYIVRCLQAPTGQAPPDCS